jgi:hypothetical protein
MTQNEARSEVTRLTVKLLEYELAVATNPPVIFPVGNKVRLSWPRAKEATGTLTELPFASLSEYQSFLRGNHYTALLTDGALIQLSFDFKNDEMVRHRFCYYPCPLILPDPSYASDIDAWFDLLDQELYAEIEAHEDMDETADEPIQVSANARLRLRSPIRFDFDPAGAVRGEPACHLHVNNGDVRIPIHSALSLKAFLGFVFDHFYPTNIAVLENFAERTFPRCISSSDELRMHLHCRYELKS